MKYSSGQKFPPTHNFLETLENSTSLVYIYSTTNALIIYIIHSFHTIINRRFLYTSLPIHKRYEIIFLSDRPKGPQLNHADVAKAVHCSIYIVKYWLGRWKQSKDLTDSNRSGRARATTQKQDQRIISLAKKKTFITVQDISNKLNRQGVVVSGRTVRRRLNEADAKYNRPMSKPLLTERHRKNRLRWAQHHKATDWNQVIFSDEMNSVKGLVWNFPEKKKVVRTVKYPIKVNVWSCFSNKGFGRIICFRQNLDAKFMCRIYKYDLLPTARKHFGHDLRPWNLTTRNWPLVGKKKKKSKILTGCQCHLT